MNIKRLFFAFCLGLLSFIQVSYAEECDINRLKQLADNVQITAEFDESSVELGIPNSNLVTVSGLTEEIYAMTKNMGVAFIYDDRNEAGNVIQSVYDEKGSAEIQIYSTFCSVGPLKTVELKLKRYNLFSEEKDCKGLSDKLDVCAKYYDGDLTLSKFQRKMKEYKAKQNKGVIDVGKGDKSSINYLYLIIPLVVIGIFVIVFFVGRKIKKHRLDG